MKATRNVIFFIVVIGLMFLIGHFRERNHNNEVAENVIEFVRFTEPQTAAVILRLAKPYLSDEESERFQADIEYTNKRGIKFKDVALFYGYEKISADIMTAVREKAIPIERENVLIYLYADQEAIWQIGWAFYDRSLILGLGSENISPEEVKQQLDTLARLRAARADLMAKVDVVAQQDPYAGPFAVDPPAEPIK